MAASAAAPSGRWKAGFRLTLHRPASKCARSGGAPRGGVGAAADAQVAELVDALASGASGRKAVKVRVLSWAPRKQPPPRLSGSAFEAARAGRFVLASAR